MDRNAVRSGMQMVEAVKLLQAKKKPRISVDALVSFMHGGRRFQGKVKRTVWNGPGKPMTYVWSGPRGGEITTSGVPDDMTVVADVPKGHRT